MRITIEGPQFAEAIQQAEWVVEIEEMDTIMKIGEQLRRWAEAGIAWIREAANVMAEETQRVAAIIDTAIKRAVASCSGPERP